MRIIENSISLIEHEVGACEFPELVSTAHLRRCAQRFEHLGCSPIRFNRLLDSLSKWLTFAT